MATDSCGQATAHRSCALVALGSNLGSPWWHLKRAAVELSELGEITARSSLWLSAPVGGPGGQADYLNAVVSLAPLPAVATPAKLLTALHEIEARHGRLRRQRNEARTLDLDLLAFDQLVSEDWPLLPHPRMMARAFVLAPLLEIAPEWRHPADRRSARAALRRSGRGGVTRTPLLW